MRYVQNFILFLMFFFPLFQARGAGNCPRKLAEALVNTDGEWATQRQLVEVKRIMRSRGKAEDDAPFLRTYPGFFMASPRKSKMISIQKSSFPLHNFFI